MFVCIKFGNKRKRGRGVCVYEVMKGIFIMLKKKKFTFRIIDILYIFLVFRNLDEYIG